MKCYFTAAIVTWVDACSSQEWKAIEGSDDKPSPCVTVGFIVKETKKYIVVAGTLDVDNDNYCLAMTIPKKNITQIVRRSFECNVGLK